MPDRAALVTALIVERPMCEGCIAAKSGCSPTDLAATLAGIQMSVRLYRATDRCRACGTPTTVLSVERPG